MYSTENGEIFRVVEQLIHKGYGRRKIADVLETTEWQARNIMARIKETDLSQTKERPSKKTTTKVASKIPFKKQNKRPAKKPKIAVESTAANSDLPSRIVVRPTALKVAVISDIHYPFEDSNAIRVCKAYLQDYSPDIVVMNGDIVDFYSVSKYVKDYRRKLTIQDEIDYAVEKIEEWVSEFPSSQFVYLEGNHEQRLEKTVKNNLPMLATLRTLNIKDNMSLGSLGVQWVPYHQDYQIGNLLFVHGHMARKHAGSSVRGHFENYGCSVLIGHIHRLSIGYKRNKYGHHALIENGSLCDFDVEYTRFPDWVHGFTTIDYDGDDFTPTVHPIVDYKLIADGKVYVL